MHAHQTDRTGRAPGAVKRLCAAREAPDGLTGACQLAEQGRIPRQFVTAYAAFRSLRNDVARNGDDGVTGEVLWSLVDIGGALLGLIPQSQTQGRAEF